MLSLTINVLLTTVLLLGAVDMPMKVTHNSYNPDTWDMTKIYIYIYILKVYTFLSACVQRHEEDAQDA